MQVVQELKFSYDTTLDPEIDKAVEELVFLLQSKNQLITDKVTPNRGGATIVNRQTEPLEKAVPRKLEDWPGKITYTQPQPEKKSPGKIV